MSNSIPPNSPQAFYILHVEDDKAFAAMREGDYQGPLKATIQEALRAYGISPDAICWNVAGGVDQARDEVKKAHRHRPGRVFDAVICDLQIPLVAAPEAKKEDERSLGDKEPNWRHGLQIVAELTSPENTEWCHSLMVMQPFANLDHVLADRTVNHERLHYHEWILKTGDKGIENPAGLLPKFRRCLIPTETFCHWLEHGDEFSGADQSQIDPPPDQSQIDPPVVSETGR